MVYACVIVLVFVSSAVLAFKWKFCYQHIAVIDLQNLHCTFLPHEQTWRKVKIGSIATSICSDFLVFVRARK